MLVEGFIAMRLSFSATQRLIPSCSQRNLGRKSGDAGSCSGDSSRTIRVLIDRRAGDLFRINGLRDSKTSSEHGLIGIICGGLNQPAHLLFERVSI